MLFNSLQYILFLPIVVTVYYLLPKKVRYVWLFIVSYYFYMQWNALYITLLFSCTLLTYVGGRIIEGLRGSGNNNDYKTAFRRRKKQRICLISCIALSLCILGLFKYLEFGIGHLNRLLSYADLDVITLNHSILLPVGISFYTLQSLGYLIDVYRGDICAEKNFIRYALFVSFFPQLVAGPIERSQNLLVQLKAFHSFSYENLRKGALLILYGLFLKMVIADRAAIIVDTVYNDSAGYPGFYIVVATFLFAIQIYCDFHGYSTIARGSALLMGIKLMDNFDAPYYARSVKEFWRRWHISLSGWFRDYFYIPLGGSRKGKIKKECNLMAVFAVSGFWHGASLSFILWGLLNGSYQVVWDVIVGVKKYVMKFCHLEDTDRIKTDCFSRRLFETFFTFILVSFAWLFFRAGGLYDSYMILGNLFRVNNWTVLFDGSLYNLGVARNYMNIMVASVTVLFIVDFHKYHGKDVADLILAQGWWFRVFIILLMLFVVLLYGCYGQMYDAQQFIYFQF